MRYAEHRPAAALAPFVECLWTAEDEGDGRHDAAVAVPESVLPDGCLEWIFHVGSPYRRFVAPGKAEIQPASLLVGLITGPLWLAPTGPIATVGVRFRPGGAHPLLRLPLEELTDSAVATPDLFGAAGRALEETIVSAQDLDSARSALERFLTRRLETLDQDRRLGAAVSAVLRSGGRAAVFELARLSGWSPRQLEREFRRRVGVPPKTLSRIARFQNAMRLSARAPGASWARVAAAAGYADQAHLIRDFRDFSGTTPSRRHEDEGELSRHFVDPTRLDALLDAPVDGVGVGVAFVQDRSAPRS
jgi:AraC-like DNA-binding protein